jgi:hypothetical protein
MSKPHSGQLIHSNVLRRQGVIMMVPYIIPISQPACPVVVSLPMIVGAVKTDPSSPFFRKRASSQTEPIIVIQTALVGGARFKNRYASL